MIESTQDKYAKFIKLIFSVLFRKKLKKKKENISSIIIDQYSVYLKKD